MSVSQTIREAAEYIEQHGMAKGCLKTSDGRACMIGAIQAVAGETAAYGSLGPGVALDNWFRRAHGLGEYTDSGKGWFLRPTAHMNDQPETTQEDVLLWMKKAAADYEEEGL